ncbi:MAG TPA: hypothetical protein VJ576_06125 [Rhodocyclaceae bacterium]|nr:hypothetical protein [Rhodocyclaceae bacterium]
MQATWTVPVDHPAFAGHFPGRPIVPGVVLVDRAILLASRFHDCQPGGLRLGSAKFLSPVGPGEVLQFSFQTTQSGALQFSVRAGDREVAAGSFSFHRD